MKAPVRCSRTYKINSNFVDNCAKQVGYYYIWIGILITSLQASASCLVVHELSGLRNRKQQDAHSQDPSEIQHTHRAIVFGFKK